MRIKRHKLHRVPSEQAGRQETLFMVTVSTTFLTSSQPPALQWARPWQIFVKLPSLSNFHMFRYIPGLKWIKIRKIRIFLKIILFSLLSSPLATSMSTKRPASVLLCLDGQHRISWSQVPSPDVQDIGLDRIYWTDEGNKVTACWNGIFPNSISIP